MVSIEAIVSIVIACVSLAGTIGLAVWDTLYKEKLEERKRHRDVEKQIRRYKDPLLLAAWELQSRLSDLVDTKIPGKAINDSGTGQYNLEVYSSYLLAHFLAWAWILRERTQFLMFSQEKRFLNIRSVLYKFDDELDRVEKDGVYHGQQPANRITVAERAIVFTKGAEERADDDLPMRPMRWDEFQAAWEKDFESPLRWFTKKIMKSLRDKIDRKRVHDDRLRRMQHLLVDLVLILDPQGTMRNDRPTKHLKCVRADWCDCNRTACPDEKKECLDSGRCGCKRPSRPSNREKFTKAGACHYKDAEDSACPNKRAECAVAGTCGCKRPLCPNINVHCLEAGWCRCKGPKGTVCPNRNRECENRGRCDCKQGWCPFGEQRCEEVGWCQCVDAICPNWKTKCADDNKCLCSHSSLKETCPNSNPGCEVSGWCGCAQPARPAERCPNTHDKCPQNTGCNCVRRGTPRCPNKHPWHKPECSCTRAGCPKRHTAWCSCRRGGCPNRHEECVSRGHCECKEGPCFSGMPADDAASENRRELHTRGWVAVTKRSREEKNERVRKMKEQAQGRARADFNTSAQPSSVTGSGKSQAKDWKLKDAGARRRDQDVDLEKGVA